MNATASGDTNALFARRLGAAVAAVMTVLALKRLPEALLGRRASLRRAETDRARRERAEAALRDANRLTDDLLAALSHELRTPLSAILGWARLLRNTESDRETTDRALESIERNVSVQTRLLDDLLDMARILSGRFQLDVRRTALTPLVIGAIEAIRPEAQAKAIRVDTALDPRAGSVSGDPERLQQVLRNLVSHAVRSTPAGGSVEIRLECRDRSVDVLVKDTGPGIPPELLPHAFEVFRPVEAAPARHQGNLGLGLAIARHLADLHGGTLRADSPGIGRGATFTLSLPIPPAG